MTGREPGREQIVSLTLCHMCSVQLLCGIIECVQCRVCPQSMWSNARPCLPGCPLLILMLLRLQYSLHPAHNACWFSGMPFDQLCIWRHLYEWILVQRMRFEAETRSFKLIVTPSYKKKVKSEGTMRWRNQSQWGRRRRTILRTSVGQEAKLQQDMGQAFQRNSSIPHTGGRNAAVAQESFSWVY